MTHCPVTGAEGRPDHPAETRSAPSLPNDLAPLVVDEYSVPRMVGTLGVIPEPWPPDLPVPEGGPTVSQPRNPMTTVAAAVLRQPRNEADEPVNGTARDGSSNVLLVW